MATVLYLRNTTNNGISNYYDMVATAGSASATCVVNTAASGTEIQFTQTAGGAAAAWISGKAPPGGFTLTTTDISAWLEESNMNANCGGRYRVFRRTAAGVETEIGGGPFDDGVELFAQGGEMLWTGNVTDQAFAENDRILLKLYITNIGTMASGYTCKLTFNASASPGNSFFNIAETVAFKGETLALTPALYTNSSVFHAPAVAAGAVDLAPALFSSPTTFYAPTVAAVQDLTPSLFSSAATFFAAAVTAGAVALSPTLHSDADTFYTQTLAATYSLTPALYSDADTFYTATVSQGAQLLQPSLYADADTFYAATVSATYSLTPSLYSDADTFYGPTVSATYALTPALYNDADTFYAATVTAGAVALSPTLHSDADTFHSPVVASSAQLAPSLYVDSDTTYTATVTSTVALAPSLYSDDDTFHASTVSATYSLTPALHADADTFPAAVVSATYDLSPSLYVDGDTFYTHVVSLGGSQTLVPGLYVDSDTFYSPTVSSTYILTPALYADPDTFYSATISSTYVIAPTLYVDPDTFYAATVGSSGGPQTLLPSLYVDPDTFYVHTITGGLGSGVGQRTRYITVEFYDGGDVWRTNIARDILEYSAQPSKIAFSYVSPQDSISYASGTDKIHYTRGQVMGSIQRRSAFKKVFVAPLPPPPPPTDPYFSNVVTLLHMDGTDGSAAFTDVKGNTFTPSGNAQIDTSQSKFGGASGLFDGAVDYFTSDPIVGMPLGTGDFTVEFFVRPAIVGSGFTGLLATPSPSGYVAGGLYIRHYSGTIQVTMNGSSTPVAQASAAWAANVWIHVAVTRESGSVRLFIDGVLQGSATTNTTNLTGTTVRFGYSTQDPGSYNGWADELRITKGVARYTANFTPPTEPFLDQ